VEFEGSDSATALVGMAGFVLVGAEEVDGELWQLVETTTGRAWCRACGCRAVSKGRRTVKVRDLPAGGRPVVTGWRKRIWRCPARECEVRTWTEQSDAIGARRAMTERARREACRRVGKNHSVAEVARELGVGWATVMAAVVDYGTPLVEDPDRIASVAQLGLDEAKYQKAGPRRHTRAIGSTLARPSGSGKAASCPRRHGSCGTPPALTGSPCPPTPLALPPGRRTAEHPPEEGTP
jgi:transposase